MRPIRRILIATDFSPTADAALDAAIAVAQRFDAVVDIVHVLEPSLSAYPKPALPAIEGSIDRLLNVRAERAGENGLVCQTTSLVGHAVSEIIKHAQKADCDLIVLGTHGMTGLAHALVGSVAERVVQRSNRLVLTVPANPSR